MLRTLTNVGGTLYGTTANGGKFDWGTVFKIMPNGTGYKSLYPFGKGTDGRYPMWVRLINLNNTLYGTTFKGGTKCPKIGGCGTVFSITTAGNEKVLHNFTSGANDGAHPEAGLIDLSGTLYGVTDGGGRYSSSGTIFKITTTGGSEKVLHSFGDGKDGRNPDAAMISFMGILVGTTYGGGVYGTGNRYHGNGTVFYLMP